MEWPGLITWLLIVGLALPLALAGSLTSLSLGLQSVLALLGLTACVLYTASVSGDWLAWVSVGMALAAALAITLGLQRVLSDEPRSMSGGQAAEEGAALLAGIMLPLLGTVAFIMTLTAVGVTTID